MDFRNHQVELLTNISVAANFIKPKLILKVDEKDAIAALLSGDLFVRNDDVPILKHLLRTAVLMHGADSILRTG